MVAFWLLLAIGLATNHAGAQPVTWTVLPVTADGIDPVAAATFRDVLEAELMAGAGARFIQAPAPCRDVPCARAAGAHTGAVIVVFGLLRPLGTKVVAQVTMVDGPSGAVLARANGSAAGIEQLDAVAETVATKLLAGKNVAAGTRAPALPPPAPLEPPDQDAARGEDTSDLRSGYLMRVGGFQPLDDTYGGLGMGMLFDMGAWIEGDAFAMEPRIGIRFDTSTRDDAAYVAIPVDFGAYFAPNLGDVRPFLGGGLGFRYIWEKRGLHVQLGNAVVTEHDGVARESGTGFGTFGRAGMVLLANHKTHLILSAEYDLTFIELTRETSAKAFAFGLAVVL